MVLFAASEGVADQPEHGWPETDEEGAALGVAALVLADRLGASPEHDAEEDRDHREAVERLAADWRAVGGENSHVDSVPEFRGLPMRLSLGLWWFG